MNVNRICYVDYCRYYLVISYEFVLGVEMQMRNNDVCVINMKVECVTK